MHELRLLCSMNRELSLYSDRYVAVPLQQQARRDRSSSEVTLLPERDRIFVLPSIPGVHIDRGLDRRNTPTLARLSDASATQSTMEQLHFVTNE